MGVEKRRIAGVAGLTRPGASWHAELRIVSLDLPCIREVDGYGAVCGNGVCDDFPEDCGTCPANCPRGAGLACVDRHCVPPAGP